MVAQLKLHGPRPLLLDRHLQLTCGRARAVSEQAIAYTVPDRPLLIAIHVGLQI